MDIMVVVWIIIWAVVSLCFPMAVAAQLCCPDGIQRLNEDYSIGPFLSTEKCTKRFLGYLLHILLLLLIPPIILILAGNEQMSRSISKSLVSTNIIYEDINTFLRNTHMQISFVVSSSTDIAIEDIREDLDAVNELLGQPIQQELASEAGIDLALIELDELKLSTLKVASMVSDLLHNCTEAKIASNVLEERLHDISRQLTVVRQQCESKDRSLCYTLQYSGFDVSFSVDNLTNDPKIRHLDTLVREDSFNSSVEAARKSFASVPERVALETTSSITDARAILNRKRTEVYKSTHALDVLTRSLSETLRVNQQSSSTVIQKLVEWDFWRWLGVLAISSAISLIWGLLLCGAPCGCGVTSRNLTFLLSGVGFSSVFCIILWGLGSFTVVFGGHGQSFICNPLADFPRYKILGELFDSDSILSKDGIFNEFTSNNDTIKVADVLKQCQRDYPAYRTFHLNNTINIDSIFNYKQWDDLAILFLNLSNYEWSLEILSPSLQLNLQNGMAFASFLVIILFLTIAPIVLKLVEYYRQNYDDLSSVSARNNLLDIENAWASPASGTPPEIQLAETVPPIPYERATTSTWSSPSPPSQQSPHRVPPPPRLPTISAGVQTSRIPQVPTISEPKNSRSKLSGISLKISKARSHKKLYLDQGHLDEIETEIL